jgi:hypothetical protein
MAVVQDRDQFHGAWRVVANLHHKPLLTRDRG